MSSRRRTLFFFALILNLSASQAASAASITLDPSSFSNPLLLLNEESVSAAAKAIGIGAEFKPITGANPPTAPLGLEVGFAASASKLPDDFREVLKSAGFNSSTPALIPAARFQGNLRLGDRFAIEAGYLKIDMFKLLGVAAKLKVFAPEEGFGAAIRLTYSDNDLGVVSTKTWTPAVIFGSKLSFAEPYFGAGFSFATAKISIPLSVGPVSQTFTASGKARGASLFGGIIFDIAALQIAFEGNYSNVGAPGLAARLGLRF